MNTAQRKYAIERVSTIKSLRLSKLQEAHRALIRTITDEDRANLVRTGKVKLKADVAKISTFTDVVDVFDFSKYAGHTPAQIAFHNAEVATLEAQASEVRDRIMLGDAEEALALLSKFAGE